MPQIRTLTPALSRHITTRQLAHLLGYRAQTLRKWRVEGRGPRYVRLGDGPGARVVYRVADVEQWLTARTFAGTGQERSRW
jgi:predicted DNA-binding transcriptional regulator AlpA